MYWVPMEITGSNEGTLKDPKFSLLDWFQKKEIPRLEAVAREVYALTGKKSIIRYQMDGAGPHIGKELLKELDQEFNNRNWSLDPQQQQQLNMSMHSQAQQQRPGLVRNDSKKSLRNLVGNNAMMDPQ
jgi:hypothetical protein